MLINSKYGDITNPKTKESKDIIVKRFLPNDLKEILIGGAAIVFGITYLAVSAFKNGCYAFEEAEFETLEDLDLYKIFWLSF